MDDLVSCANEPLCGVTDLPVWVANIYEGRCVNCDMIYMCNYTFSYPEAGETCPVCLTDGDQKFVTYRCTHRVCASCFSSLGSVLPGVSMPQEEDFGCPQVLSLLDDEQFEVARDEWGNAFPAQYAAYNDAVDAYNDSLLEFNGTKREMMKRCPLCRMQCSPISTGNTRRIRYSNYKPPGAASH